MRVNVDWYHFNIVDSWGDKLVKYKDDSLFSFTSWSQNQLLGAKTWEHGNLRCCECCVIKINYIKIKKYLEDNCIYVWIGKVMMKEIEE
jgi:hypothetical protein